MSDELFSTKKTYYAATDFEIVRLAINRLLNPLMALSMIIYDDN